LLRSRGFLDGLLRRSFLVFCFLLGYLFLCRSPGFTFRCPGGRGLFCDSLLRRRCPPRFLDLCFFNNRFFHSKHLIPLRLHGLHARTVESDINVAPPFVVSKSPIHENVVLVGMQFDIQSVLPEFLTGTDVFEMRNVVFENNVPLKRQARPLPEISAAGRRWLYRDKPPKFSPSRAYRQNGCGKGQARVHR